ncbi:MAG: VPS10 domain-containing protein, partial [Gemmatimonadaceae bacterium]
GAAAFVMPLAAQRRGSQPAPTPARRGTDSARAARDSTRGDSAGPPSPWNGLRMRGIGPAAVSGRIVDIVVHPRDKQTWYVAAASGGVWKTSNAGTTWTPVFDQQGSFSIGALAIDPRNPSVLWAGTGENNALRSVSYGDGVYKSLDGGRTWRNVGLKASEHIGKIVVDPRNSNVVYVAAQGPLSVRGGDRGLYKTTDGGATWKKVLDAGAWAGASDVAFDPRDPDVLIATTWQRIRRNYGYVAGGPESGLWRSTDGGATWQRSQTGLPTNADLGRIGVAYSPANPDVVYAIVEAASTGSSPGGAGAGAGGGTGGGPVGSGSGGGFFRSRDGGASWERMSNHTTIGLFYQEIFADPHDVDRVYSMDVRTMVTDDGGRTFRALGERDKHVDNHALWIDPDDADHLLVGCDGGVYETFDRGQTYKWFPNLPLAQFYRVDLDNSVPFYRVYGGTQDNNSVGGPSRTRSAQGITNADWIVTAGGDGFQSRVDPKDPNVVYAESQHGVLQRFDLRTGEAVSIQPQPEPGEDALRWYWDSPLLISPHANTRLYFAAQRLYRSDDRGDTWRPVSPDLSRKIDRNRLRLMDRVWSVDAVAKNTSSSFFGAIVTIAESPIEENQLWVGTDDGTIAVSEDGGGSWRRTERFPGVPDTTFVGDIQPSSHDASTVYATFDGHMSGDFRPYVLRSTDLGRTWSSISSNLPARGTVYTIVDDPVDRGLLFAGTEFGLYVSRDAGGSWTRLRGGLPTIQVRDLAIHPREGDLVAATFGRGFYILDDMTALRAPHAALVGTDALFPVKRTPLYVPARMLIGAQGAQLFSAPNPPPGATFTYSLRSELRTRRARRQAAERAAARRGEDVLYPAWDSLRAEDREDPPRVILTVADAQGNVVRRLTGPTAAGIQRVSWDLRYAPASLPPARRAGDDDEGGGGFGGAPQGPLVPPGTYTVSAAKYVDGATAPLGTPQRFEVYPLDEGVPPRAPAVVAFQQEALRLQRAVLGANGYAGEVVERLEALERAVSDAPGATPELLAEVRRLQDRARDIQESLAGDPTLARRQEPAPPSLLSRVQTLAGSWSRSLGGPTATQRRQYEIVAAEFAGVLQRLRALAETDLRRVEEAAEAAGAPWTAGRLPRWEGRR